jgi:hypothetical protein
MAQDRGPVAAGPNGFAPIPSFIRRLRPVAAIKPQNLAKNDLREQDRLTGWNGERFGVWTNDPVRWDVCSVEGKGAYFRCNQNFAAKLPGYGIDRQRLSHRPS